MDEQLMNDPSRSKKILVFTERFPLLGETFIVDHVVGLRADGWSVTVATFAVDTFGLEKLSQGLLDGIDIQLCPPVSKQVTDSWIIRNFRIV
jgi:hypothetical protein